MIVKSIEKSKEEKPVKQDDTMLFASFFYDDFLGKMNIETAKISEINVLIRELADATDDEILKPLFHDTLSADQKEQILECQLYWERQWETHMIDKKEREVYALCQRYMQGAMQRLMKQSRISPEAKQALLDKMKKVLSSK